MHLRRLAAAVVGLGLTTALVAPTASATPRHQHSDPGGTRSLATVLTSDGNRFDRNWNDYDIVTEAVLAVLANKPGSPVSVLTDGTAPLTAFIPNDRAFRLLVHDLTGTWPRSESQVFTAVAGLGIDTVETVLLYHVVPDATITSRTAARSNGAALTTALGSTITVRVYNRWIPIIKLVDQDPDDANPFINPWATDINKGNVQIAHGITRVLRPVNL